MSVKNEITRISNAVDDIKSAITEKGGTLAEPATVETLAGSVRALSVDTQVPVGSHNAIYRGEYLGSSVTDAQWQAIAAGTFEDLYIGDYWTIGGINYRIAAFDYYYNFGDTRCTTHHVTLVPDKVLYTSAMNGTGTTEGAYGESAMRTEYLDDAKTTIAEAFGTSHVLSHRISLANAVTDEYSSASAWYDSTVDLMSEQNVYGGRIFSNHINGANLSHNYTVDSSQFPLFVFRHDMVGIKSTYWLRDVGNSKRFCYVSSAGNAGMQTAGTACGVRPSFSIC